MLYLLLTGRLKSGWNRESWSSEIESSLVCGLWRKETQYFQWERNVLKLINHKIRAEWPFTENIVWKMISDLKDRLLTRTREGTVN